MQSNPAQSIPPASKIARYYSPSRDASSPLVGWAGEGAALSTVASRRAADLHRLLSLSLHQFAFARYLQIHQTKPAADN
ncbi:hypothetical protein TWF594_006728 [Orbilia oligospora]|nr:hypothetical protein TWF594_006728 [Orbilia oligospora]